MKEDEKGLVNCAQAEEMLIRKGFDDLTDQEGALLMGHLQSCEHCREVQGVVMKMQDSLSISRETLLMPDPEIRQAVRGRMKSASRVRDGYFSALGHFVVRALQYRIPVYQVVAGTAILIIAVLGKEKLMISDPHRMEVNRSEPVPQEMPALQPHQALDHLKTIDSQKIGRSVREDSLLVNYTFYTAI